MRVYHKRAISHICVTPEQARCKDMHQSACARELAKFGGHERLGKVEGGQGRLIVVEEGFREG